MEEKLKQEGKTLFNKEDSEDDAGDPGKNAPKDLEWEVNMF